MKNSIVLILIAGVLISAAIIFKPSSKQQAETPVVEEPTLQHVHGFAVDVSNPDRLLIATHHGLVQFQNGKLAQVGTTKDDLMGFTPHPSDPQIFFSSGHPVRGGNLGFQKSIDGGNTWIKVSDGLNGPVDFHSMTVSQANADLVYGHFGGIQHSMDGGQTWQLTKSAVQPFSLSSDPTKENVVYAATQDGVLVSENYGDSWRSYSSALENGAVSVFAMNPEGTYALTFSQTLGGLARTIDNGATWQNISESFGNQAVMFIAYSKTAPNVVYALNQANSIYKSTDEGVTWTKVH